MILLVKITFIFCSDRIRLILKGKINLIQKVFFQTLGVGKLSDGQLFVKVNSWKERLNHRHVVIVQSVGLILSICQQNMLATEHEEEAHAHNTEKQVKVCLSFLFIHPHFLHRIIPLLILLNLSLFLICRLLLLLFIFSAFDFGSFFVGVTQNVIQSSHVLSEYHINGRFISNNLRRLQRKQFIEYILVWQQNLVFHI